MSKRGQPQAKQTYTKEELIEGASRFNAERFEMAGALFDCTQPITLEEAKKKLEEYRNRKEV
jgi:hypothetical protein